MSQNWLTTLAIQFSSLDGVLRAVVDAGPGPNALETLYYAIHESALEPTSEKKSEFIDAPETGIIPLQKQLSDLRWGR